MTHKKQKEEKDPPVIIVYFDADRKHKQVIKPTDEFNGDVETFMRDCFNSVIIDQNQTVTYHRNYHSYEVIKPS